MSADVGITAHYTGAVWVAAGLSPPSLLTGRGRALRAALALPTRAAGLLNGGHSLEAVLLRRHRALDALLSRALEVRGVRQVVEVAAGLSGRGLRFTARHPGLAYVETDLPDVLRTKARLLAATPLADRHRLLPLDVRAEPAAWREALAPHVDLAQPTVVVAEGLAEYLAPDDLARCWAGVAQGLGRDAPAGYLASFPLGDEGGRRRTVQALHALLRRALRRDVWIHFADAADATRRLQAHGFAEVHLHAPRDLADGLPPTRGPDVHRIVEAWTA